MRLLLAQGRSKQPVVVNSNPTADESTEGIERRIGVPIGKKRKLAEGFALIQKGLSVIDSVMTEIEVDISQDFFQREEEEGEGAAANYLKLT